MPTFKIGDVVVLKSGGPKKTITKVGTDKGVPVIWCVWPTKGGKDEVGFYPADALMLATDKKPPIVNRGPPGGRLAAARRTPRGV